MPIKKSDRLIVNGAIRTKGRFKRTWMEGIRKYIRFSSFNRGDGP